ncbi:MAG: hypothetical protein AB4426_07175 [Xenococcaceae cyanobacterium]
MYFAYVEQRSQLYPSQSDTSDTRPTANTPPSQPKQLCLYLNPTSKLI